MLRSIAVFLLSLLGGTACCQLQVGVSGGLSNYLGDQTDKIYVRALTRGAFGLHAKYELNPRILLRGAVTFASVSGNDRYLSKDYLRVRNLSFASRLTEVSAIAEIHTFRLEDRRWSPYVFGGLALYHFDPYTTDSLGSKVYLKPLSTEGQGLPGYADVEPYPLTQLALPFGGGIRFNVNPRLLLNAEFGLRKLFTDYLDDISTNYAAAADLLQYRGPQSVSLAYRADEVAGGNPSYPEKGAQRGGARQKDYYYFTQLSLSIRLGQVDDSRGGRGRSRYGCPTNF